MTAAPTQFDRRAFLRRAALALPGAMISPRLADAAAPGPRSVTDLRYIARAMPLRRRHEWTRIQPVPERLRVATRNRYSQITLHHIGYDIVTAKTEEEVVRVLDGVLGGHLRRNFGDIGYHFLIDYTGRVWEGRSLAYWGAHVSGHNERNLGIVLLGNFERQRPSAPQLDAMQKLTHLVRHQYRIPQGRIYGHIDLGQTLCPGRYLYPKVQRLNQLA